MVFAWESVPWFKGCCGLPPYAYAGAGFALSLLWITVIFAPSLPLITVIPAQAGIHRIKKHSRRFPPYAYAGAGFAVSLLLITVIFAPSLPRITVIPAQTGIHRIKQRSRGFPPTRE